MIFLVSLLYLLHPLALPAGTTAVLGPTSSQAAMEPVLYRRPTTISMSRGGTVGLVVGESEEHAFDRVYVFRNGASDAIPIVPESLLGRFFLSVYNEEHGTTGFNLTYLRCVYPIQAETLVVECEREVFAAASALKDGRGAFADALIGALDARAGCTSTATFDRNAARLAGFELLA